MVPVTRYCPSITSIAQLDTTAAIRGDNDDGIRTAVRVGTGEMAHAHNAFLTWCRTCRGHRALALTLAAITRSPRTRSRVAPAIRRLGARPRRSPLAGRNPRATTPRTELQRHVRATRGLPGRSSWSDATGSGAGLYAADRRCDLGGDCSHGALMRFGELLVTRARSLARAVR